MQSDGTRIPLLARDGSIRTYAIVDDADADWVNQWIWRLWPKKGKNYATRGIMDDIGLIHLWLHREVLGLSRRGGDPEVDHIDNDGLNNRRSNLRVATHAQNLQNKPAYRNNTSGYRGVCWHKATGKWIAQAQVGGKPTYLGLFTTAEEAGAAASRWRVEHMPFSVEK